MKETQKKMFSADMDEHNYDCFIDLFNMINKFNYSILNNFDKKILTLSVYDLVLGTTLITLDYYKKTIIVNMSTSYDVVVFEDISLIVMEYLYVKMSKIEPRIIKGDSVWIQ